jgi:YidC/Oxa1 family membrane protein insertase
MIGSTLFSQRQMQKASPPGASNQQQQLILKVMPVMFGFFGLQFPAALVLYWTVSNLFQMGQQTLLLKAGHIGPQAMERRLAENKAKAANQPERKGLMARIVERATKAQEQREQLGRRGSAGQKPPGSRKRAPGKGTPGSGARPKPKRPRRGPGTGG